MGGRIALLSSWKCSKDNRSHRMQKCDSLLCFFFLSYFYLKLLPCREGAREKKNEEMLNGLGDSSEVLALFFIPSGFGPFGRKQKRVRVVKG